MLVLLLLDWGGVYSLLPPPGCLALRVGGVLVCRACWEAGMFLADSVLPAGPLRLVRHLPVASGSRARLPEAWLVGRRAALEVFLAAGELLQTAADVLCRLRVRAPLSQLFVAV